MTFYNYIGDVYTYTINEIGDDLQLVIENPAGDKVYYQDVPNLDTPSFQQAEIAVYPNPIQNTLNIEGLPAETTLHIYEVSGKQLIKKELNKKEEQINLNALSEGIYVYEIRQESQSIKTGKLVKE